MATCGCGKKLRSDNKRGMCSPCYDRSPQKRDRDKARWVSDPEYRERELARNRAWREAHPEYERLWHETHSEYERQRIKAWREANREQVVEANRRWNAENPDKASASTAARHARKRDLLVERVFRSVVWKRDQGICHLCLKPADPTRWHLDHVIALLDGGPHCYANTAVSHPSCNISKGSSSHSGCGVRWSEATGAYEQFHERKYAS